MMPNHQKILKLRNYSGNLQLGKRHLTSFGTMAVKELLQEKPEEDLSLNNTFPKLVISAFDARFAWDFCDALLNIIFRFPGIFVVAAVLIRPVDDAEPPEDTEVAELLRQLTTGETASYVIRDNGSQGTAAGEARRRLIIEQYFS
ncbi:hypothetical protein JTE90_008630 [Oedothorax gibbosus]|uniref:Uncharacterized protein n=1 Tax=Oedothorax gibbosus TaxID=931172 RepID=A0AAV6U1J9_9ARAC|nr:hypothetical protein JTE90_008630 [Oedothorax gibbosus]